MMQSAPLQQMRFRKGATLYQQGEPATHFYIVKSGKLSVNFTSSTGESAELSQLVPGDQFGYDAVLGDLHDTTVSCVTDCEVVAVPREQLQKAFTQDSYLQSVWQAPAKRSMELRRMRSQALHADWLMSQKGKAATDAAAAAAAAGGGSGSSGGSGGSGGSGSKGVGADALRSYSSGSSETRLPREEFEPLLRRSRVTRLTEGELAFAQGSVPTAVYLLKEGQCAVEHTSKTNGTVVVGQLAPGDHFGEGAVLENRDRRNCSVRCVSGTGCSLGVLSKGAFEAMLRAEPRLLSTFDAALERRNRQRLRSMITLAAERSECTTMRVRKGEVVFEQGEAAEAFFLVDSGAIQMSYRTSDGRQLPSRTYKAGEVFGASGLLAGVSTRRDTAVALEDTTLKAVPHARFGTLMRQDSLLAEGLRRASSMAPAGQPSGLPSASGSVKGPQRPDPKRS